MSIIFVGEELIPAIEYLESQIPPDKSYLVYHYTPSLLTSLFKMTNVKFEPCDENWGLSIAYGGDFVEDLDVGAMDCLYTKNRFAKVTSMLLKSQKKPCLWKRTNQIMLVFTTQIKLANHKVTKESTMKEQ